METKRPGWYDREGDGYQPRPASLGKRLFAHLLDVVLFLGPIVMPIALADEAGRIASPSLRAIASAGLLLPLALLVGNVVLLIRRGQSVGKWLVGAKIVDDQGNVPTIAQMFLRRGMSKAVLSGIFGLNLLNVMMAFRASRRCLHDDFAATDVVDAN